MAIFNMIGGGGESGDAYAWNLVYSQTNPSAPHSNTSNFFGFQNVKNAPAYVTSDEVWFYTVQVYNESSSSMSSEDIVSSEFSPSSTSYSGMNPLPKKAPASSGSIYYFNIPSGSYAGTWAWVYTSSELCLYKWDVLETLTLKTSTYTVSQSSVSTIVFDVAAIPSSYWVVLTNPYTASPPTRHVWSVAYDSNTDSAPIFTYVYSTIQKGGTSSNVSIVNQKLQFSTSGIATSLYFPRGTWTLYYIE